MAKKNKKDRIEYNVFDFFSKKLYFEDNTIFFSSEITLLEISELLKIPVVNIKKIIKKPRLKSSSILSEEQIAEIAINNNYSFEKIENISEENILLKINEILKNKKWNDDVQFVNRTPVITIMGHVDHGKTTLLDFIRKSSIVKNEVGGITQKIGAYQIEWKDKKISFIDTPGHEIFTEMRANGSRVTDIAVIVVAADDSIMPQTKESIEHAKAAKVPIIIAINKIDKPGIKIEKIKKDLNSVGVLLEEFGGDVPIVEISALKGIGVEHLLDVIQLKSEFLDLKVPLNILASGTIIESNVDKKMGNLISVIIKNGILKTSDLILIDDNVSKVKAIYDQNHKLINEATPGMPVELYGIGFSPLVGKNFFVSKNQKSVQKIANILNANKLQEQRKKEMISPFELLKDSINKRKELNIILKTNSLGSLEAITSKINDIASKNKEIKVKIIRSDTGEITNTDLTLAEASKAIIYQFNVPTPNKIKPIIKAKGLTVLSYEIVYKIFEDIEERIDNNKEAKYKNVKIGMVEVQKKFTFSKVGSIAGCIVKSGSVKRNSIVKIIRQGKIILETNINSLKIEKDNVKEVKKGKECGIILENFNDFEVGDLFEVFEKVKE